MEGGRPPSPGDELELSALKQQPDEQTPLNGAAQVIPFSAEDPGPSQANQKNPWRSCNRNVIGKCKLWMVIASIFLGLILVIIVSLCLFGGNDADFGNFCLSLSGSNVCGCFTCSCLFQLTDVYSSSPSLSRYFTSVEIVDLSGENATIAYHLQFGVPSEDDSFMKYMMSEELVLSVLRQDFHDQNMPGCETLGLSPDSLLLYE
ncbi:PREDICTED: TPA-induced transmembrane protein [Hipposideros armiger]|uniref:TPA-induced transmembrane protein n=1 Tax=Hipposideros armiger TaxID=186990 RepID=A0A8B7Q9W5_HIPAR|nr:PREDICTED: TPA-induced transmembrane protein [Hipposideros armiger]